MAVAHDRLHFNVCVKIGKLPVNRVKRLTIARFLLAEVQKNCFVSRGEYTTEHGTGNEITLIKQIYKKGEEMYVKKNEEKYFPTCMK